MKMAASNKEAGAMMGFAAMNMAQMTGGMNANSLFAMGQQNPNMLRYLMSFASKISPHSGQNFGGFFGSSGSHPHLSHAGDRNLPLT